MALRIGGLEPGQVQDAHIHCRDGDIGCLARCHPIHLDCNIQRTARGRFCGHLHRRGQCPRTRIDAGMGQPQGPCRVAARRHVHRPQDRGGHIDPRAPFIGHWQGDQVFAFLHLHGLHGDQPVRQHRHQGGPRRPRHDPQRRCIPRLVGRFVQRQFQCVGRRRGVRRRIPARIELHRRGRFPAIRALHQDLVGSPGDIRRNLDRRGPQRGFTLGHHLAADHRLPTPVAVALVPLVIVFHAADRPLHRQTHQRLAGINCDDLETRLAALWGNPVEQRFHPDHRFQRRDCLGHRPLYRPARAFGYAHCHSRLQRAMWVLDLRQGDRDRRIARLIRRAALQRGHLRAERLVVASKDIAGERFQTLGGAKQDLTLDGQPCAGGTEQILRRDCQIDRRILPDQQRRIGQRQVEVDPFWQEVLDQEGPGCQRRGFQVREHLQPPDAARGASGNRKREYMPARALILDQLAGVFHAVRPLQHRRQRQSFHGGLLGIAGQRGHIHRFPRPIGTAVGRHENVDRRRSLAALDATVGQVELRVSQGQEGDVLIGLLDHHHRGGTPPRATGQASIEASIALVVRRGRSQHRVGPVQQFHRHARLGRSSSQSADKHMQPVHPGHRRHPKVRDHEPLPGGRYRVGVHPRNSGLQRIDARRQPRKRLAHRKAGGDVLVHLLAYGGCPGPQRLAYRVGEVFLGIDVDRRAEIVILHRAQKVPVGHAIQRKVQLFGVHRLDRQSWVTRFGQHIAPAGELHPRCPVTNVLRDLYRLRHDLPIGRRKPLAEGDRVALAMLKPGHAQLPIAAVLHREARVVQLHEGRIIDARGHQILAERRTDARARQI